MTAPYTEAEALALVVGDVLDVEYDSYGHTRRFRLTVIGRPISGPGKGLTRGVWVGVRDERAAPTARERIEVFDDERGARLIPAHKSIRVLSRTRVSTLTEGV